MNSLPPTGLPQPPPVEGAFFVNIEKLEKNQLFVPFVFLDVKKTDVDDVEDAERYGFEKERNM